jgi:hypothetical protein
MQEYVANADFNIWKFYKKEIEEREKKLTIEGVVKTRGGEVKRKIEIKKRNIYKREVLIRREERKRRIDNIIIRRFSGS